ncbi:MAG TPA: hypothetical protein VF379_08300 [Gaiellaceae bacterium]
MPRRYRRPAFALGLVAAVAVILAIATGVSGGPQSAAKSPKLLGDPDSLTTRLHAQNLSTPGLSLEGKRSPARLLEQEIVDRAYPTNTLPFRFRRGAFDFFHGTLRGRGNDDNGHGWQLAGPSTATYPAVLNRNSADYVASGRITALAVAPTCTVFSCRIWVAAAGGGIWRTDRGLSNNPNWDFLSDGFGTNAIGTLTYDAAHNTLYAGTGEPNASGDSEAGVGIYKSYDGGSHWSFLDGSKAATSGNSISSIVLDPAHAGTLYVATTSGVRGISAVSGGSVLDPNAPAPGLWKSTDGGHSFSLVYDDSNGAWGVNHAELDSHGVIYLGAFAEGIWRSADGGTTWEQVFATQDTSANGGDNFGRSEFALTTVDPGGHTRIYVGDGGTETGNVTPDGASFESTSGVYRADNIDTTPASALTDGVNNPGYTSLTSFLRTDPGYATYDYCATQCWYDNFVVSPAGHPDIVYVGGSYDYNFTVRSNGKAVLLSQDAGAHWTDQTADVRTGAGVQNGIHPDQHALVTNSSNPLQFFEGSDGGLMRSSGSVADFSTDCNGRPLGAASMAACHNMLAAIPTSLTSLNAGLSTLQFQSVSVNPTNVKDLQGGTQDNGTWEGTAGNPNWPETMYGDGGQSGFDISNTHFRFNNFFSPYSDVNFQDGNPTKWVIASGSFFDPSTGNPKEASAFYLPEINDPAVSGTIFTGLQHVWRTQDFGGNQAYLEANCPEFTTFGGQPGCGDFAPLGDPSGTGGPGTSGDLTSVLYGTDKRTDTNDYVVQVSRAPSDHSTLWAATRRGRVFISRNADGPAAAVTYTRIDSLSTATPRRYVSGIVVDPTNPLHAYVSFGGYNAATPSQPGHVFDVTYDPAHGTATWTPLDRGVGPLGDLPVTGIALDTVTNHLYASTDFGVVTQVGRSGFWQTAAGGMPEVEVTGLTLDSKHRVLYAATHGRGIWQLQLSGGHGH